MYKKITMLHGAGGSESLELIKGAILKRFSYSKFDVPLDALDDAAVVNGIVFKTDSHAVYPIFFPGGDIGRLAVCGTVNDISMVGGKPIALSLAIVMEEGLEFNILEKVLDSIKLACEEADVKIVTGDTKVVERGGVKEMILNTAGIGIRSPYLDHNLAVVKNFRNINASWLLDSNVRPGDKIILSGYIGDHGIAVMSARKQYGISLDIVSDIQPLNHMVEDVLKVGGVVAMKDPTRGGLSNLLYEWCEKSGVGIEIEESKIPLREGVKSACEILGISPLEIGNEGKAVLAVVPEMAEKVLSALRSTKEGRDAQIIGEAVSGHDKVVMKTVVGGKRIVPRPRGDPIPRIC
ncbi:MAG: hydrogenase expression/formation protein HypE [Nitrososphaeria archaeon]|nr:hydrogenase expression/formation protein HypE [Nitrososphaeria archaeon]